MGFDVRVIFSGLCAFVPNQGDATSQGRPTRVQALLVDARKPKPAADGTVLMPHFPRLFLKAEQLVPALPVPHGTDVVLPLDRKELRFLIPFSAELANPFAPVKGNLDGVGVPVLAEDFRWG